MEVKTLPQNLVEKEVVKEVKQHLQLVQNEPLKEVALNVVLEVVFEIEKEVIFEVMKDVVLEVEKGIQILVVEKIKLLQLFFLVDPGPPLL